MLSKIKIIKSDLEEKGMSAPRLIYVNGIALPGVTNYHFSHKVGQLGFVEVSLQFIAREKDVTEITEPHAELLQRLDT